MPFALTNGTISLYVEATDLAGNLSAPSDTLTVMIVSIASDYNGQGVSDPALFSHPILPPVSCSGSFKPRGAAPPPLVRRPAATPFVFGPANAIPFQGDFDGDGLTDLAYYEPSNATWFMYDSKSESTSSFTLGTPNSSVPVVGNFDANGPSESAVFTINAQGQGVWTIASAITGRRTVTFGSAGDIPEPGNYDGVGHDEIAVYRPSNGQYLVLQPNGTYRSAQSRCWQLTGPQQSRPRAGRLRQPDLLQRQ